MSEILLLVVLHLAFMVEIVEKSQVKSQVEVFTFTGALNHRYASQLKSHDYDLKSTGRQIYFSLHSTQRKTTFLEFSLTE